MRVVNVPYAKYEEYGEDSKVEMRGSVSGENAVVRNYTVKRGLALEANEDQSVEVCSLYIGEYMFEAKNRSALRKMVADALAAAIRAGRDAGAAQTRNEVRSVFFKGIDGQG